MLLSVVIPIYKTPEDLLFKCLSSVSMMPQNDTDVLCIVDGQNAIIKEVQEEIVRRYPWFRIIVSPRNKGVSYSRNIGIQQAKGEYVTFVDADDIINADTYIRAAQRSRMLDLDICKFRFCEKGQDLGAGSGVFSLASWNDGADRGNVLQAIKWAGLSSVATIYAKKSLIDFGVSFPEDLRHNEDFVFITKALQSASSIGLLDEIGYCVIGHPSSASRAPIKERTYMDCLKAGIYVIESLDVSRMNKEERGWYLRQVFQENLIFDVRINKILAGPTRKGFKTVLRHALTLLTLRFDNDLSASAKVLLGILVACPGLYFWRMPLFTLKLLQHFDRLVCA